jgi:hypothetical protein
MELKDWLFLVIALGGLFLNYRQIQIQRAQFRAPRRSDRAAVTKMMLLKRYWPMLVMAILWLTAWIPYLASFREVSPTPRYIEDYGAHPFDERNPQLHVVVNGTFLHSFQ